ncbi:transglycosylase domain-containing protein, partial [Rhizobium phaseoli]
MAGRGRSSDRIEPSFSGRPARDDDEFSLDADDRVVGSRSTRRGGSRPPPQRAARQRRREPRERAGGALFGFLRRVVYWCVVLFIWAGIGVAGLVVYYGSRMPSASTWAIPERPPNVKITAVDGSVIANRGATGGEALSLENMSPYIPEAVIAIEDRRFYSHFGVDPLGLGRAIVTNFTAG